MTNLYILGSVVKMKNIKKTLITVILIVIISCFFIYTYLADASALSNIIVDVENIKIQQIGLFYCELKIIVSLSNPTDRDTSNLEASFNIYIAGKYIGEGSLSEVSISALSKTQKDVFVTIYYSEVASAVVDGIKTRDFTLSIRGEVSGTVLFGLMRVSEQIEASETYV